KRRDSADSGNERRNAVHAKDAGQLRDWQHGGLAVPEQDPRKAGEKVRSSEFCRDPDKWAGQSAVEPCAIDSRHITTAKSAGNKANTAMKSALTRIATTVGRLPYTAITCVTQ